MANAHRALGGLAQSMKALEEALEHYEQCLALREAIDDYPGTAEVLSLLGRLSEEMGNYRRASDYLGRALTLQERLGDQAGVKTTQAEIANLAKYQYPRLVACRPYCSWFGGVQVRASQGRRGRDTGSYLDRGERREVRAWASRNASNRGDRLRSRGERTGGGGTQGDEITDLDEDHSSGSG